jgi:hypothetical protein
MTDGTGMRRIGLAGAGFVAPHHLKAWQQLRGRAVVAAIADPNVDAARAPSEGLWCAGRVLLGRGNARAGAARRD